MAFFLWLLKKFINLPFLRGIEVSQVSIREHTYARIYARVHFIIIYCVMIYGEQNEIL